MIAGRSLLLYILPLFIYHILLHYYLPLSPINPRSYFKPVTLLGRPTNIRERERERPCVLHRRNTTDHINNERGCVRTKQEEEDMRDANTRYSSIYISLKTRGNSLIPAQNEEEANKNGHVSIKGPME